jgi:anti-sigma factor RsiW
MKDFTDRFVLLSAYLDGEVDPAERQQVEAWLREDASFYRLYQQQLKLSRSVQALPVPQSAPTDLVIKNVLFALEHQQRQQKRHLLSWGMVGATVLALVGSMVMVSNSSRLSPAGSQATGAVQSIIPSEEPLMIALEKPVVPLPNALYQP